MSVSLNRRLRRLEVGSSMPLPWGRPITSWSDEHLLTIENMSGAKLLDVANEEQVQQFIAECDRNVPGS